MRLLTLLFFVHQSMASFFNTGHCGITRSEENMWEQKVLKHLISCNHLYRPPPMNGSEPLGINIFFTLKSFRFNSEEQEFTAYTWTVLKWQDNRLTWDPKKYDGIEEIALKSSYIWIPNFRLVNDTDDMLVFEKYWTWPCEVNSDGKVRCVRWAVYNAKCATDLRDWPFDAQHCNLGFGPIQETGIKLRLDVDGRPIVMIGADYGAEWDIMGYDQELDQNSDEQLIMKFRLERHGDILAAIVVYPSLILTALTLFGLFIDARRTSRLLILCFSLMCHFDFLSELANDIPKHSKDPPRLLFFYRGSFLITTILICVSFALNLVCRRNVICPSWIIYLNDFVYGKFLKFIIWPRWETKVVENEDTYKYIKNWTDFANIINSVWLVKSLIVYVIMYALFMPHPIPIEY